MVTQGAYPGSKSFDVLRATHHQRNRKRRKQERLDLAIASYLVALGNLR